jgi:vacuolar-type H+-ATPase subunit C/Vma6
MPGADNYAYAVAYVRALRSRLLRAEQYEALLKTKDDQDAVRYLMDTAYSSTLSKYSGKALKLSEIDTAIFEDYYHILQILMNTRTTSYAKHILELTHIGHELSCLKIIMRLVKAKAPPEKSAQLVAPIGKYSSELILRLLQTRDLRGLFVELDDQKIRSITLDKVAECEKLNSTIPAEIAVDRFHLECLWEAASKLDNWDRDRVRDIVGTEIDSSNINLVLRGKQLRMPFSTFQDLMIPIRYKLAQEIEAAIEAVTAAEGIQALSTSYYGRIISSVSPECERERTLLPLELEMKRFLAERCSRVFIGYPFGVGPLLAFLKLKYFEALDVRAIFLGKRDRMPIEASRRLLLSPSLQIK